MISSVPAPGGGTYLRVQHMRHNDRTVCNPQRYTLNPRMPHLEFPMLRSPVGMTERGGGGCSGSDRTEISAHLVGTGEPLDILTHYVKQLESAGWKVGAPVNADGLAVATARSKDSDGVDWTGAMTVTRVTSAEVEVTIQMMRPSER